MASQKLLTVFGDKARTEDQVARLNIAQEKYGKLDQTYFGGLNRCVGLEFEMEQAADQWQHHLGKVGHAIYWQGTSDGSLRNGGIELISVPVGGRNIDYALGEIGNFITKYESVKPSVRTSIHVHCDVSDLSVKSVNGLIGLYALFEPAFFHLQSEDRKNNPYCYELTDLLPKDAAVEDNMKYCAFNLAPIARQLSVEFRHADFSRDMRKNRRWIQLVCKFMHYIGRNQEQLHDILSDTIINNGYEKLFNTIFGKSVALFEGFNVKDKMKENAMWAATFWEKN